MHRLTAFLKSIVLCFFINASVCASSQVDSKVFKCFASQPMPLEISIDHQINHLELAVLKLSGNSLSQPRKLTNWTLDEYHRALVDEKSLELRIAERFFFLSEYHSEEFGELETILSVTLTHENKTQYFECEDGSSSNLTSLFED